MYNVCMVTWPVTWLVTLYGDITSCKRFHWLHDGHEVCRHNLILDPICRTANIIHSHFPAFRMVAHQQNLLETLLSSTKIFEVPIWSKLTKIQAAAAQQQLASIQQQYSSNWHLSSSIPAATSIHSAATQQQLASIHQQYGSN